jgi:hypothetical protein
MYYSSELSKGTASLVSGGSSRSNLLPYSLKRKSAYMVILAPSGKGSYVNMGSMISNMFSSEENPNLEIRPLFF